MGLVANLGLTTALIEQLQRSFDRHALPNFRRFLQRNTRSRQWLITSDYNWGAPERPHDVAAFTVLPGEHGIEDIRAELARCFPADFKNSRAIKAQAAGFFRRRSTAFHFCFVLNKTNRLFQGRVGGSRLGEARYAIEETLRMIEPSGSALVAPLRRLQEKSRSNSFPVRIFDNVILLSVLYAFVVGVLARGARPTKVWWCSDRDRLTTWADEILWTFAYVNAFRRCLQFGVRFKPEQLPLMVMNQPGRDDFDPLIRPPDLLAGALSSWAFDDNAGTIGTVKYGQAFREALADNRNISIHRIQIDDVLHVTHWKMSLRTDPALP